MKLRLPLEQLAGCCWLPRFIDKARAARGGTLPWIYRRGFTSAIGIDGDFLRHFGIPGSAFVGAVRASADDAGIAAWFLAQPGVSSGAISDWNAKAPLLGRKGHPKHLFFVLAKPFIYSRRARAGTQSFFELIAQDEAA